LKFALRALTNAAKIVVQRAIPTMLGSKKRISPILSIPAGIEIKDRTPGSRRQKRTAQTPYLSNHFFAFSISLPETVSQ
jgi:hypothetical protein